MSLPIAWVLKDRPILLVGGGEVAETRVRKILPEQARLVVVAPRLTPYIQELADGHQLRHIQRDYKPSDLDLEHWSFVLTAIDDHPVSRQIAEACRSRHIPVNVADVIPLCDFFFGANFQQGPLKVMVSTGSGAPRLAKRVLNELSQHAAKFQFADAIANVAHMRSILRQQLPGGDAKVTQTRMLLMKTMCDKLSFPELAALKRQEMGPMIRGMILSTAACPAHPIGDLENAADFVEDFDAASATASAGNAADATPRASKKGQTGDASSSASSDSGSASSARDASGSGNSDSDEDTSSDEDASSDEDTSSAEHSAEQEQSAGQQSDRSEEPRSHNGKVPGLSGTMKRKAVECADGYPKPKLPSYPFSRK